MTPDNINEKSPRQTILIESTIDINTAVGLFSETMESVYPFMHYETIVVPRSNGATVKSIDYNGRGGAILWADFTNIPTGLKIDLFLSSDLFWNADKASLEIKEKLLHSLEHIK